MKRTDIKAGVVYAVRSSYGPPTAIVFLEDGAAGLYQREPYGKSGIRKLTEDKFNKAKRGSGWSDTTKGYAAITARWDGKRDTLGLLAAIDPANELARFVASESPSVEGLEFSIHYTLSDISGLYADERAAYDARQEAERDARSRKDEAERAASARRRDTSESLSAYGIEARGNDKGRIELSLDEADKLVTLLRAHAPTKRA